MSSHVSKCLKNIDFENFKRSELTERYVERLVDGADYNTTGDMTPQEVTRYPSNYIETLEAIYSTCVIQEKKWGL